MHYISLNTSQCDPAEMPFRIRDRGFSLIWEVLAFTDHHAFSPERIHKTFKNYLAGFCFPRLLIAFVYKGWCFLNYWGKEIKAMVSRGIETMPLTDCWALWSSMKIRICGAWHRFCCLCTSALRYFVAFTVLWLCPFLPTVSSFQFASLQRFELSMHIWCHTQQAFPHDVGIEIQAVRGYP